MGIIRQQLGKIYHFLLILVLLLILNIAFKYHYNWGGISVIVRTYIFILIFYCVFLFSQLKSGEYIDSYRQRYGRLGKYKLFFDLRLFPFIFALFLTVSFYLINTSNSVNWPYAQIMIILDGGHSNTILYALLLYFVLRQNMRPGIAIPVFLASSVLFWGLDKFLYSIIPNGTGIGIIRLAKYMIFIYVLVYDYSGSRIKMLRAALASVLTGVFLFMLVSGVVYSIYLMAGKDSQYASRSVKMLLKSGFSCQYDNFKEITTVYNRPADVKDLVFYAGQYGRDIGFDSRKWEGFILRSPVATAEVIFSYLEDKEIMLDFNILRKYAENISKNGKSDFSSSENFKKYFSRFFKDNRDEFFEMFSRGNDTMRVWIIDCLAYSGSPDAAGFLIEILTGIDRNASAHAYYALKKITGTDPAGAMNKEYYDLEVVNEFIKLRDNPVRKDR